MRRGPGRQRQGPCLVPLASAAAPPPTLPKPTLEQFKIFAVLPLRNFRLVARDLEFLDANVIVDEVAAEALDQAGILTQRVERLLQALRQQLRLGLVGRVGRGT